MTDKLTNIKKGIELSLWVKCQNSILFILDGSNIIHKTKDIIESQRLNKITEYLESIPESEIIIFMTPRKMKKLVELKQFESIKGKELIYVTPATQHDDWLMLEIARKKKGIIISNDKYQEYQNYYPDLIPLRVLTYLIITIKKSESVVLIPELEIVKKERVRNIEKKGSENLDQEIRNKLPTSES